ncbi:MAG TPA: hypothetical protein PLV70_10510 [Flavobacteriales bacterium]|nr:hypothetical protein [Flavobacteriales bacterium]HRN36499.1 hypothetical protein [Flavobacteriales bacterium]HRO40520.1 hypothetical protein [Flavobacteriales bacterium]HRP82592.1 hypothetical protein [Flavobacteriales bacterium]HRQ85534.1 hypothetical protein [Flavobacteriales bacterium]
MGQVNFTVQEPEAMDIAATKLELIERLMSIMDEKTLRKLAGYFKREIPGKVEEDDDITDEEYAEFNEAIAKHERGEAKFHSMEESMRLIRGSGKTKT